MIVRFSRSLAVVAAIILAAAAMFLPGLQWGLPSRSVDQRLFNRAQPWDGATIERLLPPRTDDVTRGADVAAGPALDRGKPIVLNRINGQIAQILRRYRLYTYQPDEMITMMSLAQMHPDRHDFDPRLYQYGGLWIYPVGALLKIAAHFHLVHLTTDKTYYYDRPAEFGKFYVVARAYSAAWGAVGGLAVYCLAKRLSGGKRWPAIASALAFVMLPVVINMAHEAKPHLGGAALMLLAVVAASRYVQSGKMRDALLAGVLCGLSFGMVLSGLIAFAILPVMAVLAEESWGKRLRIILATGIAGLLVYAMTNPYVVIDALSAAGRATLSSNLGNSTAMYHVAGGSSGPITALKLIAEGMSPILAIGAIVAMVAMALGIRRGEARGKWNSPRTAPAVLLATPALLIVIQMMLLGAGKPGEYGRFGLIPAIALMIATIVMSSRVKVPRYSLLTLVLIAGTGCFGLEYLRAFVNDAYGNGSREKWESSLAVLLKTGEKTLGVYAEPAPYNLPAIDFFRWKLILLPPGQEPVAGQSPDVILKPVDDEPALFNPPVPRGYHRMLLDEEFRISSRRLSWADKPFDVLVSDAPPNAPVKTRPTSAESTWMPTGR